MAQTKCLFLTGSFILLLAAGLPHTQESVISSTSSPSTTTTTSSSSSSSSRSFGYFNGSSRVTLTSSTWSLRSSKEVTLRTCHPQGTLLSQNSSRSSGSGSGVSHLALLLSNGTLVFQWTVTGPGDDDDDDVSSQTMSVSAGEGLADYQQYTVRLKYYLGVVYLNVSLARRPLFSVVVANDSHHSALLDAAIRATDLRVGEGFVGCLYAGPGVNFRDEEAEEENVSWGSCPLQSAPGCTTTDQNDCYRQPCQNGGTCVDMFQDYRCECPRNFNGTNCERDLAREFGCAMSPCENNATCVPLSNVSPGALPYRCTCREGFTGVNCETLLNQCEMTPNPCQHGVCTSIVNSYSCNCTGTGFRGTNCSEDIDECEEGNPCGTGQCFNIRGTFSCGCPPGSDGPMCQDIDECLSSPCKNGATCVQGVNNYTCTCVAGYEGVNCQDNINDCVNATCPGSHTHCVDGLSSYHCVCMDGYENRTGECVDIDECESNPCFGSATCRNLIDAYRCDCPPGFEGINCQVDIDECENQPCHNNATCVDGVNGFTCLCAPGYTDDTCGTDIDDCARHECRNGASCQDLVNDYRCQCVEGWTGARCEDNIDDCASNPCHNNATCNDFVAAYNCTCLPGFTGFQCQTNIDDCSPTPCLNSALCVDGANDYTCRCTSDWMGKNCSQQYDACSFQPCKNNATCNTTVPQREYTCTCVPGFNGTDCENNIDDCVGHSCQDFERCYDGIDSYSCACPVGYKGERCGEEIDECDPDPCQNGGLCNDYVGFYNCTCPQRYFNRYNYLTGYKGLNCDEDIDECAYDPPICQNGGTCENLEGYYQCLCLGQTPTWELITGLNCQLITSYCLVSGGNPCQNGATCRNVFGTYECDCVPGYTDKNCSTNINECESSPCNFNGTCTDLVNGYECQCIPGITGPNCETNIDDCKSNPCGYGTCNDKIDDYECNCTDTGFKGRNCDVNIDDCSPGVCQHNGTCLDGIKNYTCDCQAAYTGASCETDILECASSPCEFNGTCREYSDESLYGQGRPEFSHFSYATAAGYLCDCVKGTEGVNCEINIDDCVEGACRNNATCTDGIDTFTCTCAPGYEGTTCETEINECTRYSPCRNGATCIDLVADYSCKCQEFSPSHASFGGKNCSVRLSGCDQGDRCENGQCVPVLLSEVPLRHDYKCRCDQGFRGQYCSIPTTVTFSSNGSLIRYSPSSGQTSGGDVLSFRFRTTLTRTVLAVYAFSPDEFVTVEIEDGRLVLMYRDNVAPIHRSLDSQEHVNKAGWHHVFLHLQDNVSLTLVSSACGTERCVQQFAYPRGKPQSSAPMVYFGKMVSAVLTKTRTKGMFVGCLEDIVFGDDTYLYPGQQEGEYINVTQRCPYTAQCGSHTCHRHGTCVDLWDTFRCDCFRPYWGTVCKKEYTAATFYRNGTPSLAKFRLDNLTSSFTDGLDLSLFLRTRQKTNVIMYLTDEGTPPSTSSFMTLEMQDGYLASRLGLCGQETFFAKNKSLVDLGSLNFVHLTYQSSVLLLRVNDSVCVNMTVSQASCPFQPTVAYFGNHPEVEGSRQRRQAMSTPVPVYQVVPYNGIIQDIQLQGHTLDFEPRPGAEGPNTVAMAPESDVTLGAESTVRVCNTSQPCENGGNCSDVFFNDFECQCPEGYLGKNCSQPDFCKPNSCPVDSRCQSLQLGFECISKATFNGVSSMATYSHFLPYGLPSQRVTFHLRTLSFHGAILEVRARHEPHHFIKIRVRDGALEVNYLLRASGFSSSLRMQEAVNDGRWYHVEMEINANGAMVLRLRGNGTLLEEEGPEQLDGAVVSLSRLIDSGTVQVGDVADGKEQPFRGCLEELRVGGVLLPFLLDSTMNGNAAEQKFSATSLSRVQRGCQGSDACQGSVCVNGRCQDVWNAYQCQCKPGFEGEFCEREVNECRVGSCLNGALCLDGMAAHSCLCPPAFTGPRCETPFDPCANNSCANGSSCVVDSEVKRGYVCDCGNASYSGDLCNVNIENKSCADNLCQNLATCNYDQNGSTFTCSCPPGYTGVLCESPINYCVDLPCNNGTCSSVAAQQNFTCQCNTGFSGDVCDTNIDNCTADACANGGTCVDGIANFTCECVPGWTGPRCTKGVNECERDVCQRGTCQDLSPGYHCDCTNTGYTGENCSVELDECLHKFCVVNTTKECTNQEGDYHCDCRWGYQGKNCSEATCDEGQCKNGSTCQIADTDWGTKWSCLCQEYFGGRSCNISGPCASSPCNLTYTDRCEQSEDVYDLPNPSSANYTCRCKKGWEGDQCSDNIDECAVVGVCQHGGTCVDSPGSFQCLCAAGYTGELCEEDIDECADEPCQNGGVCSQSIAAFSCNCSATGYKGDNCTEDVDECTELTPCLNNNTCVNSVGSYTCKCGDQYLGERCQHQNPCSVMLCSNGGSCNLTWDQAEGLYTAHCSCVNGYLGDRCEQSPSTGDDGINIGLIIGPVVGVILLIIIIAVIVFIMVARKKRATHGAYSPSRQETAGARVELGNVLKKPPEERLI